MQSRCDVVTTQGLGGWRALAASKVVLQCCLTEISIVHQHIGHGPLSCRQRRLQACFGRCMRARGLSCGLLWAMRACSRPLMWHQSRCDVVATQGLGGWRALAATKVVLQCCLYCRSVHQHLGYGPLSCRQSRLQACFGRCMRARGLSCGMHSRCVPDDSSIVHGQGADVHFYCRDSTAAPLSRLPAHATRLDLAL